MNPIAAVQLWLAGPYGLLIRWGFVVLICVGCAGFGAYKMHKHDAREYAVLNGEFTNYKQAAKDKADAATREKIRKEAQDKADKEKLDEQHKLDVAAARDDGMRLQRDRSARGYLPGPSAALKSGDGASVEGADIESALRRFDEGTQELLIEGDQAIQGLNAVKKRAQAPK